MRIALLRKECSFRMGGAERYAANLARELCGMGHEVLMLAERCDEDIHPQLIHVPVKVSHRSSASKNLTFHRNCQKLLGGMRVDAVLALSRSFPADAFRVSDPLHDFWMGIRYPGRLQELLQRINPRHRAILGLEKGIFNPANTRRIITNSQLSKTLILRSHDYPAGRIHVVYNGVDLEHFAPAAVPAATQPDGAVRLLFVGQDFKRKGLAPLIEALGMVHRAGHRFHLRVVGRDQPGPYRKLGAARGIADRIIFEAATSSMKSFYQEADLLVFPTLYDPFANVCLEALACGLPVMTTTTNGASEILTEGEDGFVVDGTPAGLSENVCVAVTRFCEMDAAERASMRARARTTAERFTIGANARKVIELLS